jgi:hypothetical protein
MQNTTPEEKAAAEKRWPHINAALDREPLLTHLCEWTKTHPPTPGGPEPIPAIRQAMMGYLIEQFLKAPPAEVADALAEMVSADLMKKLIDMSAKMFGEPKDNTDSFAE